MSCNRNDCAFKGTHTDTCDYILITGKRRGCPAGPLCLRYKPVTAEERKERKVLYIPTTFKKDHSGLFVAFQSLYEEGYSDQEIADAMGVGRETVGKWRREERLPGRETRRQIMSAHEKAALALKTESGLVRKELTE